MSRAVVIVVLLAGLAACGNDNADRSGALTTARADTSVTGRVEVTGSSTVKPISTVAAEAFRGQNRGVDTAVEGPGTGDGFARFCVGDADVTGASRPITDDERASCAANGIRLIELAIGLDGVAVVASPDNPVACLTFADLYALVGPEAQGIGRWRDAAPVAEALGSTTTLPDERLVLTGPGEESGTYDAFLSIVVEPESEARVTDGALAEDRAGHARSDYAASADDNAIIEAVAGDTGGLGWVGLTYAEQADDVRLVPVARDPDGPCVEPTRETVQDGSYPIIRELFVYVSDVAAARPAVAAFVDFYLAGLADFLDLTDAVPVLDPAATVATWQAARP